MFRVAIGRCLANKQSHYTRMVLALSSCSACDVTPPHMITSSGPSTKHNLSTCFFFLPVVGAVHKEFVHTFCTGATVKDCVCSLSLYISLNVRRVNPDFEKSSAATAVLHHLQLFCLIRLLFITREE